MSYGLMVYSVSLDKLTQACGSGDDALRRAISGRFKNNIAATNDDLGYSNERNEPSLFMAIRHLILGDEMVLDGALYAYGFKYIVEFYGKFLDNSLFYPAGQEFLIEEVGSQLANTGAKVRMDELLRYSMPVKFPRSDDFPLYGYWKTSDVAESVGPLKAYAKKSNELEAIQKWLETASAGGEGIVGYYY